MSSKTEVEMAPAAAAAARGKPPNAARQAPEPPCSTRGFVLPECPLCHGTERYCSFLIGDERFDECKSCGLLSHKAAGGVVATSTLEYGTGPGEEAGLDLIESFLSLLEEYVGSADRSVGVTGRGSPAFVEEARRRGFDAHPFAPDGGHGRQFDVIAIVDLLEDTLDPIAFIDSLRDKLYPGGTIAVVTRRLVKPGWQSQPGRILRQRQRYSFSDHNLQTIVWKAGFDNIFLGHWVGEEDRMRAQGWFKDHAMLFGRMQERRAVPTLSVVVPVYNEAGTVRHVLDALSSKEIPGVNLEIIVVESSSSDGSRDIVLEYKDRPGFTIALEERARGKGFAVREGLRHATGDVVLIQDADLEHDFLDYEMLIDPILAGRTAFVLGTRHAGHWKIRRFGSYFMADAMNLAHWCLVFLMNRLYEQSMTDPFTMFKVFRRDCLSGLEFECNRFDFDVELVCKLLRKGYTPLEIPVNYQARSFKDGKKVGILRDPPTWIKAMLKYRFSPEIRAMGRNGPIVSGGKTVF